MQPSLLAQGAVINPLPIPATRDHGVVPDGVSRAHHVDAADRREYIVKCPVFAPDEPYAAANEYLAASFGKILQLPLLNCALINFFGNIAFGSEWLRDGEWDSGVTAESLCRCENRDMVHELAAFDTWLCNGDRHQQNLIIRHLSARCPPVRQELIFNDHSRCLMPQGTKPAEIGSRLGTPAHVFVKVGFLRSAVQDFALLKRAVVSIESMSEATIRTVVRSTPATFLDPQDHGHVECFLLERQRELRAMLNRSSRHFPALEGATL